LTLLAVPDSELGKVADLLVGLLPAGVDLKGRVVAHCSGVHGPELLDGCARVGAATGVWHPLAPIPDGDPDCLQGAYVSVGGDAAALPALERLAGRLGLVSFRLEGVDRALYHAAAALSGVVPVLIEAEAERAMAASGAPAAAALGLRRLLLLAAENVGRLGPVAGLSGPSTRNDSATTRLHQEALAGLEPRLAELYRLALELAAESVPKSHLGVPNDG